MKLEEWEQESVHFNDVKQQLRDHIQRRSVLAHAAGDRARDEIGSKQQWEERRNRMRAKMLESIGGLPHTDAPLNPKITGVTVSEGFSVENIIFESRPQTYVCGNLYLPADLTEPRGTVLHVLGHSPDARFRALYQIVCHYLVHAGLIVFVIDPIGQGERYSYYDPVTGRTTVGPSTEEHEHAGAQSLLLGQGAARYFIHDTMRALDYLATRSEVDAQKIGITGVSGGGTQTHLSMLLEERIAAAAPACYTTSREALLYSGLAQDAEQIWPGLTASGFDHEDMLLAFAPKPLLVLAGIGDSFPIEGTQRTVARARRFWQLFGRGDDVQLYEEDCGHTYSPGMAQAAAAFFARHLLGKEVSVEQATIRLLDEAQLRCTQSGQVRGDFADARAIHEENAVRLTELEQRRAAKPQAEQKQQATEWLRRQVWAAGREACGSGRPGGTDGSGGSDGADGADGAGGCRLNPRYIREGMVTGEALHVQSVLWRTQAGIFGHGLVFRSTVQGDTVQGDAAQGTVQWEGAAAAARLPVTVAVWEGGTGRLQQHAVWIRQTCASGRMVLVVNLTGVGPLAPYYDPGARVGLRDRFGVLHKLATDLFWLGDSLAAIRIFDVLRALDMARVLRGAADADLQVYTHGRYSLYPQLAAWLDPRLRQLQVVAGFGPMADWVRSREYDATEMNALIVPGILQYLDIP